MDRQEFIDTLYSEYSSKLAVSKEDISEMISRGFLVCDEEYLQHYTTHFNAFKKKYEKYEETQDLLTASQLHEYLIENVSIDISEAELGKMAEFGLLKRGEDFQEITIAADVINKRKEDTERSGIREKIADIEAHKERHLYLFSPELTEKGYEYWYLLKNMLLEKLEELENEEDELGLDEIDEDEDIEEEKKKRDGKEKKPEEEFFEEENNEDTSKDKSKRNKSASDDYIKAQREEDARRLEEQRHLDAARMAEQAAAANTTGFSPSEYSYPDTSYEDTSYTGSSEHYEETTTRYTNTEETSYSETDTASSVAEPQYNSVNIPLSDGSYITVAPATPGEGYKLFDNNDTEAARVQAVLGSHDSDTGKYQVMSQAGLGEIIEYIKKNSADESVAYVPVAVTITKDGETTTLFNEATNEGSTGDFYRAYYQNKEIPEYSDVDRQIQYAIGAVNFNDGTHENEFEIKVDEYGNKSVQWTPPEYITSIAPSVYSDINTYAQQKYETVFNTQTNTYEPVDYSKNEGSGYSEQAPANVITKHYDDISYGYQPNTHTNASPTSDTQLKMMESGAGTYLSPDTVSIINAYREQRNEPPIDVPAITMDDVTSAPKAIQQEMAQAYVSTHAVTYEDLQRVDSPVVGQVFETKYAEQTNNANVGTAPTWASAQKAKADYEAGIGNGLDSAEREIREKYNAMSSEGFAVQTPNSYTAYNSEGVRTEEKRQSEANNRQAQHSGYTGDAYQSNNGSRPVENGYGIAEDGSRVVDNRKDADTRRGNEHKEQNTGYSSEYQGYSSYTSHENTSYGQYNSQTAEESKRRAEYEKEANRQYSQYTSSNTTNTTSSGQGYRPGAGFVAAAVAVPVFVSFKNTDNSGKIAISLDEVQKYASTHVMSTTTKKNVEGQTVITPYYQNFVAGKEIEIAKKWEEQRANDNFYGSKEIHKNAGYTPSGHIPSYQTRGNAVQESSSHPEKGHVNVITKSYDDIRYGSQPDVHTNATPTSIAQLRMMESGAGVYATNSVATINEYRQRHNQPPILENAITMEDVVSAPKPIQKEMAQAYVSTHAVTYEDLQRVENPTVGKVFEEKYAAQTNNAQTNNAPTWASAQKAKADYEAGIGDGIDSAEREIRKKYSAMGSEGFAVQTPRSYNEYNSEGRQVEAGRQPRTESRQTQPGSTNVYGHQPSPTASMPSGTNHQAQEQGARPNFGKRYVAQPTEIPTGTQGSSGRTPSRQVETVRQNNGYSARPTQDKASVVNGNAPTPNVRVKASGNTGINNNSANVVPEAIMAKYESYFKQANNTTEGRVVTSAKKHKETATASTQNNAFYPKTSVVITRGVKSSVVINDGIIGDAKTSDRKVNTPHVTANGKVKAPQKVAPMPVGVRVTKQQQTVGANTVSKNNEPVVRKITTKEIANATAINKTSGSVVERKNTTQQRSGYVVVPVTVLGQKVVGTTYSSTEHNNIKTGKTLSKSTSTQLPRANNRPSGKDNTVDKPDNKEIGKPKTVVSPEKGAAQRVVKGSAKPTILGTAANTNVHRQGNVASTLPNNNGNVVRYRTNKPVNITAVVIPVSIGRYAAKKTVNGLNNTNVHGDKGTTKPSTVSQPEAVVGKSSVSTRKATGRKPVNVKVQNSINNRPVIDKNIPSSPVKGSVKTPSGAKPINVKGNDGRNVRGGTETISVGKAGRVNSVNINAKINPSTIAANASGRVNMGKDTNNIGNGTLNRGRATSNINNAASSAAAQRRVTRGTNTGTAVIHSPARRVNVKSIGKARGLETANKPRTPEKNTPSTNVITKNGTYIKTANRSGRVSVHVARADKEINDGLKTAVKGNKIKPTALDTITVNFTQKGLTGKTENTVLVLNSDKTGMMRIRNGKEVIEGKFRGFASDLGKDNSKASKRNRQMEMAEAFERGRILKNVTIDANGKRLYIDPEWLLHNSKNINNSLGKFKLGKGNVKVTRESAEELTELLIRAKKEGALLDYNPYLRRPVIEQTPKIRAKSPETELMSKQQLAQYFKNSESIIKEAEKKTKKQGRRKLWSSATRMIQDSTLMSNDMAVGARVLHTMSESINILTRAGQKGAIKQENLNINKKFMRTFVGNEHLHVRGYNKIDRITNDIYRDGIKLVKNHNGISRLRTMNDIRKQVQESELLRRNGVNRMSVREISKILQTGKLKGQTLTDNEKSILFNIVLLKTTRNGHIEDINGVLVFNKKFKEIQLTGGKNGTYNFNTKRDIQRALNELNEMSLEPRFKNLFKGKSLSQMTDTELRALLRNKNLTNAERELIKGALTLRAFLNEKKENDKKLAVLNRKTKETLKHAFRSIITGTDAGIGYMMLKKHTQRITRMLRALTHRIKAARAKKLNKLLKKYSKYSKDKGLRGLLNKSARNKARRARYESRLAKVEGKIIEKERKQQKKQEKRDARNEKIAKKIKGVRTRSATRIKTKFNNSAVGKKFAKLRNSKIGKIAGKLGVGVGRTFRVAKGLKNFVLAGPLKIITIVKAMANVKDIIMKTVKKYAIIALGVLLALNIACAFLAVAYDSVTGFLYSNKTSNIVDIMKAEGVFSGIGYLFSHGDDEDGDVGEYGNLSSAETLVNDRIQYCVAMDSALREYIEGFYTNEDIIDSVSDANNEALKEEDKLWLNPANSKTFKDNLKDNKKLGTTVNGLSTGIHYTYYDGDGNIISMRSNAKDIIAVANTWIGTDLSAKGAYKTYIEKLWAYTHFVGYALRENYGGNFVYACNSHANTSECYNNIALYYCNKKNNGKNSAGTDNLSKKMYEALNEADGSIIHNGNDVQLYVNEATKQVNGAMTTLNLNKTIGKNTSSGSNEDIKTRMENVAKINSSYTAVSATFASGAKFSYVNSGKELVRMSYTTSSGATGTKDILYRNAGVSKYGTTEKGSWAWIESDNGCTRHEPKYHLPSGDITTNVLSSAATKIETLIDKDNAVTLLPERTKAIIKFYQNPVSGCDNYGTVTGAKKVNRVINGTTYTSYEPTTAYYCKGHIDGCGERKTSTASVEINTSYVHNAPNTSAAKIDSMSTYGSTIVYHMKAKTAYSDITKVVIPSISEAFKTNCSDGHSHAIDASRDKIINKKTNNTMEQLSLSYDEEYPDKETADFLLPIYKNLWIEEYPGCRVEGQVLKVWHASEKAYYYRINLKLYQTFYYATYDIFCLGHPNKKTVNVESVYCTGYCAGHEMAEYCTGHIDLDVGVVTLYADETTTNNIMNLGVAKTATVTTSEDNYQAREENGRKDGDKITVTTVESDSADAHDYLFTSNAKLEHNLTKYVFKEWASLLTTNEFLLPKVDSKLEYKFVHNDGSFVTGDKIVRGINFIKAFVDGDDVLSLEDHSSLIINGHDNDYDDDDKITLLDIVAKAYASFAYEKFKDFNDDISAAYGNFINMPTVAKKNGKDVHFIGFYEYVINGAGTLASLKIQNGEYVDTSNIARVHESIKEDWLQLYQIEFPGAYNAIASDTEIQKLAFHIAIANYASTRKMGLTITGPTYAEYNNNNYLFMNSLYKYPETYVDAATGEVRKKPRGTGFLSAWDANDVEKTTNCLGKPAYYGDYSDGVNFALEWGAKFLQDLGLTSSANKYLNILNTANFKDVRTYFASHHIDASNVPTWISNVYQGNNNKAANRITAFKGGNMSILKEMKSTYVRQRLMTEAGYVNGADAKWDDSGDENASTSLNNVLTRLKTGDIVGFGDEIYLVLYQDSSNKKPEGYHKNGEPIYNSADTAHGYEEGKVYLLTIGDIDKDFNVPDNEIHIFAYSLELLNLKRNSIWIYAPSA